MTTAIQNEDYENLSSKEIYLALKKMGFTFPETKEDFQKLEEELRKAPLTLPSELQEPLVFLNKKATPQKTRITSDGHLNIYENNFAQAAREGNSISEAVKRKMEHDKKSSRKS